MNIQATIELISILSTNILRGSISKGTIFAFMLTIILFLSFMYLYTIHKINSPIIISHSINYCGLTFFSLIAHAYMLLYLISSSTLLSTDTLYKLLSDTVNDNDSIYILLKILIDINTPSYASILLINILFYFYIKNCGFSNFFKIYISAPTHFFAASFISNAISCLIFLKSYYYFEPLYNYMCTMISVAISLFIGYGVQIRFNFKFKTYLNNHYMLIPWLSFLSGPIIFLVIFSIVVCVSKHNFSLYIYSQYLYPISIAIIVGILIFLFTTYIFIYPISFISKYNVHKSIKYATKGTSYNSKIYKFEHLKFMLYKKNKNTFTLTIYREKAKFPYKSEYFTQELRNDLNRYLNGRRYEVKFTNSENFVNEIISFLENYNRQTTLALNKAWEAAHKEAETKDTKHYPSHTKDFK